MLTGARPSLDQTQSSPTALAQEVCFKPHQSLVGSAGISGYTIANPAIWFGFLGSDPDFSTEDNKACVAMSTTHLTITKDTYSHMYSTNVTRLTQPVPRGKLDLTCSIGSADDCVATFTLTFNGGTVVTGEALGSDVLEEK
ncbi:hypothetical protein FVEG_10670 [Fusarium verticillioides 7600]|uniref:Uncharacterized protein n=1 Tax=Gibberella moniliformis (strain M3125 / FGSC 7600) TaxID=334819 RepID=W7ML12_GIBM7|nr:hypothetical protein FVEG_10670 [Fusarium verticillioides 7600]EWG51786.1 hypothetical protein FVEG_10670 [Fusarium verticillioides 7600]